MRCRAALVQCAHVVMSWSTVSIHALCTLIRRRDCCQTEIQQRGKGPNETHSAKHLSAHRGGNVRSDTRKAQKTRQKANPGAKKIQKNLQHGNQMGKLDRPQGSLVREKRAD
mmetsp:Transcript_7611/g.17472  ORF Transcript_7611/g.17472 Transcript_7611/m.17472 type:complete len:112 (+) Transcript_7611:607-942(+)